MRRSRNRSTSADGRSWGSYKPSARRSASESRNSGGIVNVLQRGMSPACGRKMSLGGLYSRNRGGSLLDNKRITKDPRPLGEKAYQIKCLSALAEFLTANSFPYSTDVKKLATPSKKDFERIFEFLWRYWDPKFVTGKLEDDAPKILKMLNYPFIIIKSTFLTVNRMSWPALLGVLMWLMQLNQFSMNLDVSWYFQTSDFDSGKEHYDLLDYILTTYSNNINDPEKDYEFFSALITKRCPVDASIEDLERALELKKAKLAEIQKEEDSLRDVEKSNQALENNIEKYDKYLAQMEKHIAVKEEDCFELAKKLKGKESELEQIMKATEEKEKMYNQQGYDGQQKQRFLLVQNQNLSKELEEKKERLAQEEKTFWDIEIANSTLSNKVLTMCQEFNGKYAGLPSVIKDAYAPLKKVDIPSASKLYSNFKVSLPEFEVRQSSIMNDYSVLKGEIIPALDKLKAYLIEQKDQVNNIIIAQRSCLHELVMKMSELKIKADLIKAQSAQKQREKDSSAKEFSQEIARLQGEHEAVVARLESKQKEVANLEKLITSLKLKLASDNAKIQEARTMHELYRKKAKEVFQEMKNMVKDVAGKYDEIQSLMLKHLTDLNELMNKTQESSTE